MSDDFVQMLLKQQVEFWTLDRIYVWKVIRDLRKAGIKVPSEDLIELEEIIGNAVDESEDGSGIHFELDFDWAEQIEIDSFGKITQADIDDFQNMLKEDAEDLYRRSLERASKNLLDDWKNQLPTKLKELHDYHRGFSDRLYTRWEKPLSMLEAFVQIALDGGKKHNSKNRPTASRKDDVVFDVVSRLHARGSQVAWEICTLLKNGFSDGAFARWRTLHELAVTAIFIEKHGQDVAERYIDYQFVETRKNMRQYNAYYKKLGFSPLSEEEIEQTKKNYEKIKNKYGKKFVQCDYSWASKALGNPRPNFTHLEQDVGLDFFRPFVKMSHANIHASAKSIFYRLGLYHDSEAILSGPSDIGLSDPICNTANSLFGLTSCFLSIQNKTSELIFLTALHQMRDEVYEAVWEFEEQLAKQDKKQTKENEKKDN